MTKQVFNKFRKSGVNSFGLNDVVEVKIFKNKTNHQFNLPVLKKNTSPEIIRDILNNKDVVGLKFKITDVILKKNYKGGNKK